MTNEAILRQLAEKERQAKFQGVQAIVQDFRMLLAKLGVLKFPTTFINWHGYINKHSPIFNGKIKKRGSSNGGSLVS